ncbi:MAG TPA: 4-hydroxythreonine-4-phosphate dehydrogenase, partial [Polyangiaceae bacterium]|nr:4-hydroxythreonine-4-phosphate dehydrogenase [Polyangiaceae bacterium]
AARRARVGQRRLVVVEDPRALEPGQIGIYSSSAPMGAPPTLGSPTPEGGAAQLAWIDQATDLVISGRCGALVTGPVSKAAIASSTGRAAKRFRGHTEHLARRLGADEVVMAFRSSRLTVSLVTTHLPLARVPRAITVEAVAAACYWLGELLTRLEPGPRRVVVAALNPHAGEGGLLGDEESTRIEPGMARARGRLKRRGVIIEGPVGAETAFRRAAAGDFQGVVAMYHDQATVPLKLLGFGEAVNVTLGLPIVRTSVDHGTAYDRAASGGVSSLGMEAALSLAASLAGSPRRSSKR